MTGDEIRKAIRAQLERLNPIVEQGLRRELARPIELGYSGHLQFEVDGLYYGISLIQTEEAIFPGDAVWDVIREGIPDPVQDEAEEAGIDLFEAIHQELFPWFAEQWEHIGGPKQYHPAYAFYHGGLNEPRYDLELRRWLTVAEVFGE